MKHLTIRDVPADLARALEAETRRRGASLTQTVKDLLRQSLNLAKGRPTGNGLARLAGGWSEEELRSFEKATRVFEQIDEDVWK